MTSEGDVTECRCLKSFTPSSQCRLTEAGCTCKKVWFTTSGQTCDHYCKEPQILTHQVENFNGSQLHPFFSEEISGFHPGYPLIAASQENKSYQGCNPEDSERHGKGHGLGKTLSCRKMGIIKCSKIASDTKNPTTQSGRFIILFCRNDS